MSETHRTTDRQPDPTPDDDRPDPVLQHTPVWAEQAAAKSAGAGADIGFALAMARTVGAALPSPGAATAERWAALAALARANVTVARVVEAHVDALAILAEAGCEARDVLPGSVAAADVPAWGVFASEGGAAPLRAVTTAGRTTLTGTKPWCSLAGELDAALVTAHEGASRRLFAVNLRVDGVRPRPADGWVSRGLPSVVSVGIDFDDAVATPVGEPGWYLTRPGFAWGGMGVAACWHGAARGVADRLPDGDGELAALYRGRVDAALHAGACALADAAARVDTGSADGSAGVRLALQVRAVVAHAVETVLLEVGHATGPAPLAFEEPHAARVADLAIYVRQHHADRDLAALGRTVPPGRRA